MLKTQYVASDVGSFLKSVAEIKKVWFPDAADPWGPWFRGQKKGSKSLLPSLYREYGSFWGLSRCRMVP